MSAQRLYKAEWVDRSADWPYEDEPASDGYPALKPEPEGWREYALEKWGTESPEHEFWPDGHKPFFFPATDRIFRSRSAAQNRVDIINRWGGHAVVVECTPLWETVEHANRRRAQARLRSRVAKKRAELADLEAQLGGAQISGCSLRDLVERIESGVDALDGADNGGENFAGLVDSAGEIVRVASHESSLGNGERTG